MASELPLTSEIFRCFEVKRQAGRYRQVASLETWMALVGAIDAVDDDSYVAAFSEEPCNWFSANSVHCLRSKYIHHHDPPCSFFTPGQEPIKRINSIERARRVQCLWYVLYWYPQWCFSVCATCRGRFLLQPRRKALCRSMRKLDVSFQPRPRRPLGNGRIKGPLGVPLTVYPWYLWCSLRILKDCNP